VLEVLKLVKLKVLFLSPFFLPRSPHSSRWVDVHFHIPPSTLSGYLFRSLAYIMDRLNVRGDYWPCEIGRGLLARVDGTGVVWYIAEKEEAVPGFKPPYLEFHFKAVSLGAYPVSILRGEMPEVYFIEKYWNVIKYIDVLTKGLRGIPYDVILSIKTWHYAIMDGTRFGKSGAINLYEVAKVRHVLVPEEMEGFVLVSDPAVESLFEKMASGWFIMKTRMKNLLAIKVDGVLEQVSYVDSEKLRFIPTFRKLGKFTAMFASNIIDLETIAGNRRDRSIVEVYLYVSKQVDDIDRFLFFGNRSEVYAVDKEWLQYISAKA